MYYLMCAYVAYGLYSSFYLFIVSVVMYMRLYVLCLHIGVYASPQHIIAGLLNSRL